MKQHVGDRIILGSGDLFNPHACLEMLLETGVDGVTVARGAIGNPWIFNQTRALAAGKPLPEPPSLHEQRDYIREHYLLAEGLYGEFRVGPLMRKFGIKYSILHPHHGEVRADFVKVKDRQQWEAVLEKWYADDLPGVHPNGRMHKAQSSCQS